jgi:magnesium chelatase family protein
MRPFRSPHHTVSSVGLAGGGSNPKPGEISLAHNGVLFLDEFTEFDRRTLEILREPLETGKITISRAARKLEFPASFQLIAAMNPCANGCDIDEFGQCNCNDEQLRRYRNKISAPLLDRIDLQINVPKLTRTELISPTSSCDDQIRWLEIQQNIHHAREAQLRRQNKSNAYLDVTELAEVCKLSNDAKKIVNKLFDHLKLSARSYHRILKVARTIADLAHEEVILKTHITEAASYRQFDRLLKSK